MDFELLINDSIEYTRETFAGHWDRWLILALLGLPFSLIRFLVDPERIVTKAGISWELIPWIPIAAIVVPGILGALFIGGYTVRIYRGTRPAPGFTGWLSLFIDGFKMDIVMLAWFLPAVVLLLAQLAMVLGMISSTPGFHGNPGFLVLMMLLLPVEFILFLVGILFAVPGAVRFARTGSMAEGWRFSAILGIIRRIGWWHYLVAFFLIIVVSILFSLASSIPASIPYVGWLVPVGLAPFLTVFVARYFTLVYMAGDVPPSAATAGQPGP